MPSAAVRRSEADQLIETLHTVAADPALWESLVTALADAPADAPSEADMDGLEDAPVGPPAVGLLLRGGSAGWVAVRCQWDVQREGPDHQKAVPDHN